MLRASLRPYIAFFLLLCLTRTLLPEAWVLALHGHEHTTEEPAFAKNATPGKQPAVLTSKHTHCHAEQFYDVSFQAAPPVAMPQPRVRLAYQPLAVAAELASSAATLRRTALRGPPAVSLLSA